METCDCSLLRPNALQTTLVYASQTLPIFTESYQCLRFLPVSRAYSFYKNTTKIKAIKQNQRTTMYNVHQVSRITRLVPLQKLSITNRVVWNEIVRSRSIDIVKKHNRVSSYVSDSSLIVPSPTRHQCLVAGRRGPSLTRHYLPSPFQRTWSVRRT